MSEREKLEAAFESAVEEWIKDRSRANAVAWEAWGEQDRWRRAGNSLARLHRKTLAELGEALAALQREKHGAVAQMEEQPE